MKRLILLLALAACGDNIAVTPDAQQFKNPVPGVGHPLYPNGPDVPPDAAEMLTPDVCIDSHIDLNGHEHKCQHIRP